MQTEHARIRAQQRGVPPLIECWLLDYGEAVHDGHGGIRRFFSKRSRRQMERALGREPVRRMREFFDCYLIEAADTGATVTVGHRFSRIRRP
ncbi:hypothetical protein OPU71_02400 [Niveibacterium sp. 24ML]|uniref:hypothetical protein n=1 Tax=Niveibacterium sp. 24ML TaxID=2985512 RepID=UPI00226F48C0|nr:hypothetical protein [Niveibacterium sp. 24ML]MCX9154971.1 hypothetical protein [Niveibacterium sp. 24ML]